MAHWAEIDDNNVVKRVLVTSNDEPDEGYSWLVNNLGGRWIQASYNTRNGVHAYGGTPLRGNYPGMGWIYDETLDAFLPQNPYPSWTVNTETYSWEPPVPRPEDGKPYLWIEASQEWILEPTYVEEPE